MTKKLTAAVILSGCGFLDGSEIGEAILSLTSLSKHGIEYSCFAPQIEFSVVDHITGQATEEKRDVMTEASRIPRGKISPLTDAKVENFDMLIMPGGFGVAKNLSDIAISISPVVIPDLNKLIVAFFKASKPIGCICISPVAVTCALSKITKPAVTIGKEGGIITSCGGVHVSTKDSTEFFVDTENKIYSCAAYMNSNTNLHSVFIGIDSMVGAIVSDLSANESSH